MKRFKLPKISVRRLNVIVTLFIIGFLAYILFAPLNPATYKSLTIQDSNSVEAGSQITYHLNRCRHVTENVNTTVIRNLIAVDKNGNQLSNMFTVSLSSDLVATPRGCSTTTRTVLLPSNVPEGYYKLRIVSIYQILPIRKPAVVEITSPQFMVRPPTISEQVQTLNSQLNSLRDVLTSQGVNISGSDMNVIPSLPTTTQTTPQSSEGSSPKVSSQGGAGSSQGNVVDTGTSNTGNGSNNSGNQNQNGANPGLIQQIFEGLTGIF